MKLDYQVIVHTKIAGFTYCEGPLVFNKLSIGTLLTLVREEDNKHDYNAIALYFGESKIGFVPASDNEILAILFDLGYKKAIRCFINQINKEVHPEQQIGIVIQLMNAESLIDK
ncbi:MAG: HIRAN domain-containing protein [Bacteroides sp.]